MYRKINYAAQNAKRVVIPAHKTFMCSIKCIYTKENEVEQNLYSSTQLQ